MKMQKEIVLPPELAAQLAELYETMEADYDRVAQKIGQTCTGCPDNCCDSYFLHYTYTEWAYLWDGLRSLDHDSFAEILNCSKQYVDASQTVLARGDRPQLMCPLNEKGLCKLYTHRLMICRLHGIPATMTRPDGQLLRFPGCFRCQEIVAKKFDREEDAPAMNRTQLLHKVAAIESELLDGKRHLFPKVRRTIAEMVVDGPPRVDKPFCEK